MAALQVTTVARIRPLCRSSNLQCTCCSFWNLEVVRQRTDQAVGARNFVANRKLGLLKRVQALLASPASYDAVKLAEAAAQPSLRICPTLFYTSLYYSMLVPLTLPRVLVDEPEGSELRPKHKAPKPQLGNLDS